MTSTTTHLKINNRKQLVYCLVII